MWIVPNFYPAIDRSDPWTYIKFQVFTLRGIKIICVLNLGKIVQFVWEVPEVLRGIYQV